MTGRLKHVAVAVACAGMWTMPVLAVSEACSTSPPPTLMSAVTGLQRELAYPVSNQSEVTILNRRAEIAFLKGNSAAFRLWTTRLAEHPDFQARSEAAQAKTLSGLAEMAAEIEPTALAFASAAAYAPNEQRHEFWSGRLAAATAHRDGVDHALKVLKDPLLRGLVLADAGTFMGDQALAAKAVETLEPLIDQLSWRCQPKELGDAVLGLLQAEIALGRTEEGIGSVTLAMRAFDRHLYPEQWARAARKLKRLMADACQDGDDKACSFREYFKMIEVE